MKPCLNQKGNKGKAGMKIHGQILTLETFTPGSVTRILLDLSFTQVLDFF